MSYLLAAWTWVLSHPALAIPLATGAVSLLYTRLGAYPRVHAFFSLLAGAGLDLPTMLDALKRLLSGAPPTAGKLSRVAPIKKTDPDATTDPGRPAALAIYWMAILGLGLWISGPACTKTQGQQVTQAITNLTPAGACIVGQIASGNVEPLSIITICGPVTIEDIIKEVDALLAAPEAAPDGGLRVKRSIEFTTHLLTLKANCEKYLDGGVQ